VLASDPALTPSALVFQSPPPVPPANDNFADAMLVGSLPFSRTVDATAATTEPGEPQYCNYSSQTVWYTLTPDHNTWVGVSHYSDSQSNLAVYRAYAPGFVGLAFVTCGSYNSYVTFPAEAGATYYFQQGTITPGDATLSIDVKELPGPKNDDFANAIPIGAAPYTDSETITYATTQAGEQRPSCTGSMYKTIWYAYTPTNSGSFMASTPDSYFDGFLAVWTGSQLGSLTEAGCRSFWGTGSLAFRAEAGATYYIQVGSSWGGGDQANFRFEVTPPPQAKFYYWPNDPSVFDTIQFQDNSGDPAGMGIQSQAWDFGDGAVATGCCPAHKYTNDGDYTVKLAVTTPDGRTGSTAQTVKVMTHDVAISKIDAPQAARAGQTRQISVNIKNTRYPETVRVELLKSVPGGFQSIASVEQNILVRSGNRTTAVGLSYTFTDADAAVGKVTFKAVVYIVNARDALPADNEAIATPTKVGG
jgi:hypothetical protein